MSDEEKEEIMSKMSAEQAGAAMSLAEEELSGEDENTENSTD
jgi:hypothetical protein